VAGLYTSLGNILLESIPLLLVCQALYGAVAVQSKKDLFLLLPRDFSALASFVPVIVSVEVAAATSMTTKSHDESARAVLLGREPYGYRTVFVRLTTIL
jgi:hypothetical protein